MAFSYDPSNDLGKVRLYIHDNTDGVYGTDYEFTDADILSILEQEGDDVWLASSTACRILAVKATPTAFILKLPGALELDRKDIAKIYNGLADKYEHRALSGPDGVVEFIDSYDINIDQLGKDRSEYVGDI